MPGCGNCGLELDLAIVGRRDACPRCGAELRACIHCRHFDPNVAKSCKEPFAEPTADLAEANFCDYYQLGEGRDRGAGEAREAAFAAAEALFGPPPKG